MSFQIIWRRFFHAIWRIIGTTKIATVANGGYEDSNRARLGFVLERRLRNRSPDRNVSAWSEFLIQFYTDSVQAMRKGRWFGYLKALLVEQHRESSANRVVLHEGEKLLDLVSRCSKSEYSHD